MPIVAVPVTEGLRTEPDRLAGLSFPSYTYRSDCRSNGWNVGVSGIAGSSGLNEFRTAISTNIRASMFLFHYGYFVIYGSVVGNPRSAATDGFRGIWATIGALFCFAQGAISGNGSWRQGRCDEDGDKCRVANVFDGFHGISFSQFLINY
jgi:hypothetical protein